MCLLIHAFAIVCEQSAYDFDVICTAEEVFVVEFDLTVEECLAFRDGRPKILLVILDLVSMRMKRTIRGNDTIAVQAVVCSRIAAKVATIGHNLFACHTALGSHALINEVPDESTLVLGVFADQFPVFGKAPHAIAHSVGILTLDERTWVVALSVAFAVVVVIVHWAEDVGFAILMCLLILYRTGGVDGLDGIVGIFEVFAITSFVTKAPENDAGVVLLNLYVVLVTLNVCLVEDRVLS